MIAPQPQSIIRVLLIGLPYSGLDEVSLILENEYNFKVYVADLSRKPSEMSSKRFVREICFQEFSQVQQGLIKLSKLSKPLLDQLRKRNYFNVVSVESSFKKRYQNYILVQGKQDNHSNLLEFMDMEEEYQNEDFVQCLDFVRVRVNNSSTWDCLREEVKEKINMILRPFRPSWDEYFMKIADIARRRSNCMKASVGAVIVNNKNRVVSTGYNGTPKGLLSCFKNGCERCNMNQGKQLDQCLCLHAEQSAIIEVGIYKTAGCRLYTTYYPCFSCAKVIKQAGILKIYYADEYQKEDSGKPFIEKNFDQSDVIQIKIDNVYY